MSSDVYWHTSKSLQCNSQSSFLLCESESRVKERPGSSQQDKLADALWTRCPLALGLVKLNVMLLPSQERKCTAVKPTYEMYCPVFIAQGAEKSRPGMGRGSVGRAVGVKLRGTPVALSPWLTSDSTADSSPLFIKA